MSPAGRGPIAFFSLFGQPDDNLTVGNGFGRIGTELLDQLMNAQTELVGLLGAVRGFAVSQRNLTPIAKRDRAPSGSITLHRVADLNATSTATRIS